MESHKNCYTRSPRFSTRFCSIFLAPIYIFRPLFLLRLAIKNFSPLLWIFFSYGVKYLRQIYSHFNDFCWIFQPRPLTLLFGPLSFWTFDMFLSFSLVAVSYGYMSLQMFANYSPILHICSSSPILCIAFQPSPVTWLGLHSKYLLFFV